LTALRKEAVRLLIPKADEPVLVDCDEDDD
jgi:hypothetical protein